MHIIDPISWEWINHITIIEGSLEVKLPTIWTNEKQRWKESERREEWKREDQRREGAKHISESKAQKTLQSTFHF